MLDNYFDQEGNMIIPLEYTDITLPEGLVINKNLIIKSKTLIEIPDDIIIKGGLIAPYSNLQKLPQKLTLGGDLDLTGANIEYLPTELRVAGCLKVSNSKLISFPSKILVGHSIYAKNIPTLKILPKMLIAGLGIYLTNTNPDCYPEYVIAGRDIYANNNYNYKINEIYYGSLCRIIPKIKIEKLTPLHQFKISEQKFIFHPKAGIVPYRRIQLYYDKKMLVGDIPQRHLLFIDNSTWELGVDYEHYYVCTGFEDGMLQYVDTRLAYYNKTNRYTNYTSYTRVTRDEARQVYSDLSGCCPSGVGEFYNNLKNPKNYWTIKELIELTDGEVGNAAFKAFIRRNEQRLKEAK